MNNKEKTTAAAALPLSLGNVQRAPQSSSPVVSPGKSTASQPVALDKRTQEEQLTEQLLFYAFREFVAEVKPQLNIMQKCNTSPDASCQSAPRTSSVAAGKRMDATSQQQPSSTATNSTQVILQHSVAKRKHVDPSSVSPNNKFTHQQQERPQTPPLLFDHHHHHGAKRVMLDKHIVPSCPPSLPDRPGADQLRGAEMNGSFETLPGSPCLPSCTAPELSSAPQSTELSIESRPPTPTLSESSKTPVRLADLKLLLQRSAAEFAAEQKRNGRPEPAMGDPEVYDVRLALQKVKRLLKKVYFNHCSAVFPEKPLEIACSFRTWGSTPMSTSGFVPKILNLTLQCRSDVQLDDSTLQQVNAAFLDACKSMCHLTDAQIHLQLQFVLRNSSVSSLHVPF